MESVVASSAGAAASRTVLGRGLLYTGGTAAPILSNAVVTPFVTRALDPAPYGVVATSLVLIQVGMIAAGVGLAAAITRHGILEDSGVGGARSLVLRGTLLSAALAALAALAAPAWAPRLLGISDVATVSMALAAAGAFAVVVNVQSYLRVLDRPGAFGLLSITGALGGPVAGVVLVHTASASAAAYVGGLMAGYVVAAALGLALVVRGGPAVRQPGDTRRALRIGLPTVPHQVALYLAGGILVLVAGWVFDHVQAGRLQLAVLVGSAAGVLTSSLNNAWAPVVYRTAPELRAAVLERTGRDIALLTSLAAGFVAISAPFLLAIVAPPSFELDVLAPATGLVAAGTVLSVPYLCNVHLVFASGRSGWLAAITPASLALGTLAAWVAAGAFGVAATGVGMTVTYAALTLATHVLALRVSQTRWRWQVLLAPLLLGGVLCGAGGALPSTGWALWVRAVTAGVLVVASLGALLRVRGR